jgi:outer membrane protein insertion porin family
VNFKYLLYILLITFVFSLNAKEPKIINEIIVRGNARISKDAILDNIKHKPGKKINEELIRKEIQDIFEIGYFNNVNVYKDINKKTLSLIYEVKEKAIIRDIVFKGNSEESDEDLKKEISLKPYTVLNISDLKKAKLDLLKFYEGKGYYLANIKTETKKVDPDEDVDVGGDAFVDLIFNISENSKIKVKKITIIGNKNIHEDEIKNVTETKEDSVFAFFTGAGSYKKSIVDIDRERIAYYYGTKGFPHVRVIGPITYLTPDKKWIYITYRIEEGDKYKIGSLDFKTNDVLFSEEQLNDKMELKTDEVFNTDRIRKQIVEYQNLYGDKGYAFTNVTPLINYDEKEKKANIVFNIEKGRKVYFGRFTVKGNEKTRDKVIRREMNVFEGELYNHSKLEVSKQKIMALGFFDDVTFRKHIPKNPDGTNKDVLDIDIHLKERSSTGSFMLSAGYSSYEGVMGMAQIQERNFLGRGQTVTLRANFSKISALYYLSFYEPYLFDTKWGFGFDLYRDSQESRNAGFSTGINTAYETTRTGFNLRISYPLMDFLRFYTAYKFEYAKTDWVESLSNIFVDDVENGYTSSMKFTLEYDKRNDRFNPTKGFFSALSSEVAGVGGNKRYVKSIFDNRYYRPIFWDFILRTRFLMGNIAGYGGKPLPYSERFLMGGVNTLRGFDFFSQGPIVYDNNGEPYVVGGKNKLLFTAEVEIPILEEIGLKGVVFFDYGNSFDVINSSFQTDVPLRADWGLGFRWNSPMGPLRFEWGMPIDRRTGESKTVFQFMIGPPF